MPRNCSLSRSSAGCRAATEVARPGATSSTTARCVSSGPVPLRASTRGLRAPRSPGIAQRHHLRRRRRRRQR
eukprot:133517-Alexandrium_andersonii.AAC.1